METPKGWVCDACGSPIEVSTDGWIEWLLRKKDGAYVGRGLRLVHRFTSSPQQPHGKCQYDERVENQRDGSTVSDMELDCFLGADGLMRLLSLVAEGELPKEDVLEMIKRLHIPGYEHAHRHFERAISEGVFEPNTMPGYYHQHNINAVLQFLHRERGAG